jgi:hypothetical protein
LAYTDDVVALLSWTGHSKPMVFIGWAAVSDGQLSAEGHLPSPLADNNSAKYGFLMVLDYPSYFLQSSHGWD